MNKCRYISMLERWFDGESVEEDIRGHVEACSSCAAHLKQLQALRDAAQGVPRDEIASAQFLAFMAGIREGVTAPEPVRRPVWRLGWMAAAVLVLTFSLFWTVSGGPDAYEATVVESCSSDLEGATVSAYASDDGVMTVAVMVSVDEDSWGDDR